MLTIIMVILAGLAVLMGFFCIAAHGDSKEEVIVNHLGAVFSILLAILVILIALLFKRVY